MAQEPVQIRHFICIPWRRSANSAQAESLLLFPLVGNPAGPLADTLFCSGDNRVFLDILMSEGKVDRLPFNTYARENYDLGVEPIRTQRRIGRWSTVVSKLNQFKYIGHFYPHCGDAWSLFHAESLTAFVFILSFKLLFGLTGR